MGSLDPLAMDVCAVACHPSEDWVTPSHVAGWKALRRAQGAAWKNAHGLLSRTWDFMIHEGYMKISWESWESWGHIFQNTSNILHKKTSKTCPEFFRPDLRRFGTRLLRVSWAPRTCQPAMFDGLMAWETDRVPADNLSDHIETYDDMW
jgi:hypothetical protein